MSIPTPCHVIDLDILQNNLEFPIKYLREKANCHVLLAIKGFSLASILEQMKHRIDGVCASGLYEARLGKEKVGKHVFTFSPAYQEHNFHDTSLYSNAIVFNSMRQFMLYNDIAYKNGCTCGIRINPDYSELPKNFDANPCQKHSRLGIRFDDMPPLSMFDVGKIEGIHLHTMCEQGADVLERTSYALIEKYDSYLKRIKWLNLGGGQLFSEDGYDLERAASCLNMLRKQYGFKIYVEPCTGIMGNCGFYIATVVDIVQNEMDIAILNGSAICHMPDTVFRNWKRNVKGADEVGVNKYNYRLTGSSCFAGDIWGDYSFPNKLEIGDQVVFEDSAHYTSAKNSMFNGIPLPTLVTYSKANGYVVEKKYGYEQYANCQ